MLSAYQKQLNRIYFFSNKVVSVGKIDYKPQFKPIDTLINRLKKQLEQKVSLGIEKELTLEQMENRVKLFLPSILSRVDLSEFTFKEYYTELERNKILTKGDISTYKKEIKEIITKEVEKFLEQKERKQQEIIQAEQLQQFEVQKQELERQLEKTEKKRKLALKSDSDSDLKAKFLINEILEKNKLDEDIGEKLQSRDFDKIFQEMDYRVNPESVADIIYTLFKEGKIDKNMINLNLSSAEKISEILEKDKGIVVSKYIIQSMMGRNSKAFDLKNILLKNLE